MCGIAGYIGIDLEDQSVLRSMTDAIAHRGPDGEGLFFTEGYAFGHRRLAIVDLSASGKQPMHYKERYVITYNGELYNHIELKQDLIRLGYTFTNHTDTEVLMAAYDHWGAECLKKFNGMWSFVLFDNKTNKYFISRDRFGKKPLYYYKDEDKFIFCSEVKGIYASGLIEKQANESYLKSYLVQGPNDYSTETAFKDVFRFPFAHYFEGTKEELLSNPNYVRYWEIKVNNSKERFQKDKAGEYANKYYELLSDAVRIRLRADVKVGSALSGGLDSSSIVYLVNQELKMQDKVDLQETFSSVYKSDGTQDCDESEYIDLLAKELNVSSNQIEPEWQDIPKELEHVIWNMENPPESTCMSGWHTFKKVKEKGVTVTLDGQGADEQLAGYLPYIASYLTSISLFDLYKEFFHFFKIPGTKRILLLSFILAHIKSIFGKTRYSKIFYMVKGRNPPLRLNEELKSSMEKGLVTLIHYSDHVSMGHSVESRMPFMDHRLVEFLATVPACYKMHNGWTKYLARLAFDKKLPDEICWRKDKMGWPIPESYWFKGRLKSYFMTTVDESSFCSSLDKNGDHHSWLLPNSNIQLGIRRLNLALFEKLFFRVSK